MRKSFVVLGALLLVAVGAFAEARAKALYRVARLSTSVVAVTCDDGRAPVVGGVKEGVADAHVNVVILSCPLGRSQE